MRVRECAYFVVCVRAYVYVSCNQTQHTHTHTRRFFVRPFEFPRGGLARHTHTYIYTYTYLNTSKSCMYAHVCMCIYYGCVCVSACCMSCHAMLPCHAMQCVLRGWHQFTAGFKAASVTNRIVRNRSSPTAFRQCEACFSSLPDLRWQNPNIATSISITTHVFWTFTSCVQAIFSRKYSNHLKSSNIFKPILQVGFSIGYSVGYSRIFKIMLQQVMLLHGPPSGASPAEIQCPGDDTKDEKHQRKLCGPRSNGPSHGIPREFAVFHYPMTDPWCWYIC